MTSRGQVAHLRQEKLVVLHRRILWVTMPSAECLRDGGENGPAVSTERGAGVMFHSVAESSCQLTFESGGVVVCDEWIICARHARSALARGERGSRGYARRP